MQKRKQKTETLSNNFELFINKAGKYQWRKTSHNGHIMATSCNEYSRRIDCVANANRFGLKEELIGENDTWTFTKHGTKSRWTRTTIHGRIVGVSNLFSRITDCTKNAELMGYAHG